MAWCWTWHVVEEELRASDPLLTSQPSEVVRVTDSQKLCVPVAKSDPPPRLRREVPNK